MDDICDKHGPYSVICKQCDLEEARTDSDYFAEQLHKAKEREAVLAQAAEQSIELIRYGKYQEAINELQQALAEKKG